MIRSREELKAYLEADKVALGRREKKPKFYDLIWKYEIALRYCEYYTNIKKNKFHRLGLLYWKYKKFKLEEKTTFSIHVNSFEKGLSIAHVGPIIVNAAARIGCNCRIHVGVNIGTAAGTSGCAPQIGENVYIGPGAKIFGSIEIADGVAIGANAVVNKTCMEKNVTLAGVPARIVSYKGSEGLL